MYLPYIEHVVDERKLEPENFNNRRFVGFLSPIKGMPLNYSHPFGIGGHDNNHYTSIFETYFIKRYYDCFLYGDKKEQDKYEKKRMEGYIVSITDKLSRLKDEKRFCYTTNYFYNELDEIELRLYEFFYNCYQNELFSEGYGKKVMFIDDESYKEDVYEALKSEYRNCDVNLSRILEADYNHYVDSKILDCLKETFIQYMGLHSIERTAKTITTSNRNIYETFFNYLLNDFTIYKLPNMIFDDKQKKYIKYDGDNYFLSSKEQKLKQEIESIKRMVKKEDRYKYYRD